MFMWSWGLQMLDARRMHCRINCRLWFLALAAQKKVCRNCVDWSTKVQTTSPCIHYYKTFRRLPSTPFHTGDILLSIVQQSVRQLVKSRWKTLNLCGLFSLEWAPSGMAWGTSWCSYQYFRSQSVTRPRLWEKLVLQLIWRSLFLKVTRRLTAVLSIPSLEWLPFKWPWWTASELWVGNLCFSNSATRKYI